ncbi:MAG: porin [Moraxella sp.]|nr:porin [Moraxella sp.]
MKKLLLASAIATLSITAVQAAPTVYGKAFLTLDIQDGDDLSPAKDSRSQLNSVASRIGFKGSEALTTDTDLVYQLEYRVDIDDNRQQFTSRDTYLGLSNKQYGTLVAGRLTAIDDYINYVKVVEGGVVGGNDTLASINGPRANNAFAYFSPEYQGVQFMGMYAMDEVKSGANNGNDSLARDAWGIGAKYEPSDMPLKAGITYIKAGASSTNEALLEHALRVSGAYALGQDLTVAGQYQLTEGRASTANKKEKEQTYTVSGNYKVPQTPWTAYTQLDYVKDADYVKGDKEQRIVIGGKYAFNQNTTGHLYSGYLKNKPANASNYDSYGVGAGLEYKF